MSETWKPLKGYEDTHEISSSGRCRRLCDSGKWKAGMFLKPHKLIYKESTKGQRMFFRIYGKTVLVHRAIAITFIPNPHNKPEVNHIDGDTLNNSLDNLEWVTSKENNNHAFDNHLNKSAKSITLQGVKYRSIAEATRLTGISRYLINKMI